MKFGDRTSIEADHNEADVLLNRSIAHISRNHVENQLGHFKHGRGLFRSYNKLWKLFSDLACDAGPGLLNIVMDGLDEGEEKSSSTIDVLHAHEITQYTCIPI